MTQKHLMTLVAGTALLACTTALGQPATNRGTTGATAGKAPVPQTAISTLPNGITIYRNPATAPSGASGGTTAAGSSPAR